MSLGLGSRPSEIQENLEFSTKLHLNLFSRTLWQAVNRGNAGAGHGRIRRTVGEMVVARCEKWGKPTGANVRPPGRRVSAKI